MGIRIFTAKIPLTDQKKIREAAKFLLKKGYTVRMDWRGRYCFTLNSKYPHTIFISYARFYRGYSAVGISFSAHPFEICDYKIITWQFSKSEGKDGNYPIDNVLAVLDFIQKNYATATDPFKCRACFKMQKIQRAICREEKRFRKRRDFAKPS